ncbi:penicillin-binding protein 1A [Sinimarinibacterium flocculans]|uniref:Penicillin-binding protein 1A n=1 Tax=Sinimarinibacterium flocculans TaxID=985250 RepID=A0A318E7X0_9GAMM|nr:penicillin-binding protein 1A [Sinimarinibacterium flocculans]PXV64857.1 penicillin-binding protein 1A [Sinimarinibacterium flocculans]
MTLDKPALRVLLWLLAAALLLAALAVAALFGAAHYYGRDLPSVASLRELQLSVPLRIYSRDGKLMGEFGSERRALLRFEDLPPRVVQAFLAAEDDRFFEHPGVDWQGLLRAALKYAATGEKSQGGSTITMQLARNVFLSSERTFTRKFKEILLALRIERELDKPQIMALYLNKIFLGERAYGVGAAALVYFGRDVGSLSLGETAVIAGLPKAPSRDNPVANPVRATERRDYVLRRMRELGYISRAEYEEAVAEPLVVQPYRPQVEVEADYVAEMVRAEMVARFGEEAYSRGLNVTTTVDASRQTAANAALRQALLEYDRRHGWRGTEARIPAELLAQPQSPEFTAALGRYAPVGGLQAAVVQAFDGNELALLTASGPLTLGDESFAWAKLDAAGLAPGDVVRIDSSGDAPRLAQIPEAQGALVALNPDDGAIEALVGGFDFFAGKFNRVTQARRQAGSGFKPFLYATAMAHGYTPASVLLDAPVVFDDPRLESTWRPENYGGDIKGPMRLREALVQSRNLVSIRLLMGIGIDTALDFIPRFGLPADRLPRDLTMALGSAVFTPLEMARGYATIANGGFVVDPYVIVEVRDSAGEIVERAQPRRACPECLLPPPVADETQPTPLPTAVADEAEAEWLPAEQAVDPAVAWLVGDMLHDVTVRGTAAKVAQLQRNDLAGKTGTTNDETDAWFNGFQRHHVAVVWVGFDQPTPLGRGEVGGRAALPAWMDYMRVALDGVPQERAPRPPGLVNVRIDRETGFLAAAGDPDAIFETVPQNAIPPAMENPQQHRDERNGLQELF